MASSLSNSSLFQSLFKVKPEDLLKLDPTTCGRVWYKWKGTYSLDGIELGCFKDFIFGTHSRLFSKEEQDKLYNSSSSSDLDKHIWSALQRLGGHVLWAVYDTLVSTAESAGAQQHSNMANSLLQCMNDVHLEDTRIPTIKPNCASSLGYKTGTAIGKGSAGFEQQDFHGGRAESDCQLSRAEVSHVVVPPGSRVHHGESGYQSGRSHVDESKQEVANHYGYSSPALEQKQPSQEQSEQIPWDTKEYVAEFTDFLVSKMPPKHVIALANELIDGLPGQNHEKIKQKIHCVVLKKNLSLYHIAKCLLARNQLFHYIFEISGYTEAHVTGGIVDAIVPHIGNGWQQLALTMSMMNRTCIDCIKEDDGDLFSKIRRCFEEGLQFPRFPNIEDTLSLLVEIIEKASLGKVALAVRNEFARKFSVNVEHIHSGSHDSNSSQQINLQELYNGIDNEEDYTAASESTNVQSERDATEFNSVASSVPVPPQGGSVKLDFTEASCQKTTVE
jgi:hypothetical protein